MDARPPAPSPPACGGPGASPRAAARAPLGWWLLLVVLVALRPATSRGEGADAAGWSRTQWNGETAFRATDAGWEAIVSVERGRLVHLGRAGTGRNLLYAPPTRDQPHGWGGHRVWLGPQSSWPNGWPPPAAWESQAAANVLVHRDGTLELAILSAGDTWPAFSRRYRWSGGQLRCAVALAANGTRPVQVIQILQVPAEARVQVELLPVDSTSPGYVGLPSSARRKLGVLPEPPPHATVVGRTMRLRHIGKMEKLGFRPQPLVAQVEGTQLTVGRGEEQGPVVDRPDDGFTTQVYLGGHEAFIELEQLSGRFSPGVAAQFEMTITPSETAP